MKKISYIDDVIKWQKGFKYSYPVKVRFSETDAFGHLNNTKVFVYFEVGRIEFFKEIGLMADWLLTEAEAIIVTADMQCNYLQQIFFDDQLEVFVKIQTLGNSSADLHYMIKNQDEKVCITGRGRMVQVHKKTGKPLAWDEVMKKKLEATF